MSHLDGSGARRGCHTVVGVVGHENAADPLERGGLGEVIASRPATTTSTAVTTSKINARTRLIQADPGDGSSVRR